MWNFTGVQGAKGRLRDYGMESNCKRSLDYIDRLTLTGVRNRDAEEFCAEEAEVMKLFM